MCVLSINVPIPKKFGNLFDDPHIYLFFLLNSELIYKQKQCLRDVLYQTAKGIIKTALKFMYFLFRKIKNYLMFGFEQSKERIFYLLNLAERVFF